MSFSSVAMFYSDDGVVVWIGRTGMPYFHPACLLETDIQPAFVILLARTAHAIFGCILHEGCRYCIYCVILLFIINRAPLSGGATWLYPMKALSFYFFLYPAVPICIVALHAEQDFFTPALAFCARVWYNNRAVLYRAQQKKICARSSVGRASDF